ncbi:MAG: archaeosine synthase subunit alpha [Methanothrix sp.]|uniref:archaeosine synthase subunit alpha n=1 Tax=Methanothrix sp. TaxID=90426 RepID=UPI0025D597FF|nr:archaeosine synthase subunit alpha [Methanothrix sp.]MCQ8902582.1 archaeosine synthase subunit alpha [Methanothrix sp.]
MRFFEVLRRDGPARLGRLMLDRNITTPCILSREDYVCAGSVFRYRNPEEAREATISLAKSLKDARRLIVLPYPSDAAKDIDLDIDAPRAVVTDISSVQKDAQKDADVYVLRAAGTIAGARDLVDTLICIRESIPPDSALYAPALATPSNLSLLVYLGVDIVDSVRVEMDGHYNRYHTRDGVFRRDELSELPCMCEHCSSGDMPAHNILKLEEELVWVRECVRSGTLREYVERQVRCIPWMTAALRLADRQERYLERRTPTYRKSVMYANTSESLHRVEVRRFVSRVLTRYRPPESDVLLLLPCSARKPYSESRSHRLFRSVMGSMRRFVHELILTSPLAIVPRELEDVYPAAHYDTPVTGVWDLEERAWLMGSLRSYLERHRYSNIVAHLEGELCDTLRDGGIDAVYTGGGTGQEELERLREALEFACKDARPIGNFRLQEFRAKADYYFGSGAGDVLTDGARVKGNRLFDSSGRALASISSGRLALTLEGARMLLPLGSYTVRIGDFIPKGTVLAPGVVEADEQIRPGDEVIVVGDGFLGAGRARMSGWEMAASRRGVAVELREGAEV